MHTYKLTTKCHLCAYLYKSCMHCCLMCGIWDWQSTIVEDLNDSQDPKHTLFSRENAFVAIYALFSDIKCPLFTRLGGGSLFLPFFLLRGFPYQIKQVCLALNPTIIWFFLPKSISTMACIVLAQHGQRGHFKDIFQGVNKFISNMRCNRYISNEIKTWSIRSNK